ncbi:hypothetical protein KI688_012368 [Linnemannia hyalina]|uniref:Uncharacterized protein n=1 Tax=Linnemannia hyalina TaxID=64524 RepID=A0A9P8BTU3_9FUNG|nr:hypothetical protein KI688_012368 [Linnemannia hyalina]
MDPKPTTTTPAAKPKPKPTTATTTAAPPKKTTTTAGAIAPGTLSVSTTPTISPSASASPDASSSSGAGGLPVAAIAGIAAGGAVILMFLISILVCKKRRSRRYASRPDGHDPSRDPIDPNDVLPFDNKYDQRTPTLAHSSAAAGAAAGALSNSRGGTSRDNDSGFISYPLALRGASEDEEKVRELAAYQDPRTKQTQQALEQEYSHYDDHIQSHFAPESPEMTPASLRPGPGPGPASPTKSINNGRAQHLPTPISTTNPSMELSRNTPAPMSPSQRGFQQNQQQQQPYNNNQESLPISPRSRPSHPLASPTGPRGQNSPAAVIVNDMGNEFVMQSSNTNSLRESFDQEGSVIQSELSYRRGIPPRKSQESNLGGGYAGGASGQYPNAGTPSPMALGPQRGLNSGGRPGPGPGPGQGPGSNSTFSSPRQGPSGYPTSPPVLPSQYPPQHQYQPPPQQGYQPQPYQQYPQDNMSGYGSPPMRPQQQRPGPGGYPGPNGPGGIRSPPMSPQSRGGYSPHMGPGYPQQHQQQYQQQSNYPPQQQQSPNHRPRNNY